MQIYHSLGELNCCGSLHWSKGYWALRVRICNHRLLCMYHIISMNTCGVILSLYKCMQLQWHSIIINMKVVNLATNNGSIISYVCERYITISCLILLPSYLCCIDWKCSCQLQVSLVGLDPVSKPVLFAMSKPNSNAAANPKRGTTVKVGVQLNVLTSPLYPHSWLSVRLFVIRSQ